MSKKIRIGPVVYTVLEVPDLCDDDGEPLLGQVTTHDLTIRVAAGLPEGLREMAEQHEIIHIILDQAGRAESRDEGLINCLAYGLAQLRQVNGDNG